MIDSLLHAQWLRPDLLERMGWVLLHFLWQGAAIAALLAVTMFVLRRRSPVARYRAACLAMLLMLAAPVITYFVLSSNQKSQAPLAQRAAATAVLPGGHAARATYLGPPAENIDELAGAAAGSSDTMTGAPAAATQDKASPPAPGFPFAWIVLSWIVGVTALSLWRFGGWLHLQRLLRLREPLPAPWPQRIADLSHNMGVRRPVAACLATWVSVPAVAGFLRPILLLPASAISGLTPDQLQALLAHELAHVRRRDYLVNLAQSIVETILFYHPAVWWVSSLIREEREQCCDDMAAAACGDPATYAAALAAMETVRSARPLPAHLALAAWGRSCSLLHRVRRLLGVPNPSPRARASHALAALVALGCIGLPLAVQRMASGGESPKRQEDAPPKAAAPIAADDAASTRPAGAPAEERNPPLEEVAKAPTPEDLKAERVDYRIGRNDLLTITVNDLNGPGVQTVKTTRVSEAGNIRLPFLDFVSASGRTEGELEREIIKSYEVAKIIQHAQVSVQVTEARGRNFSVLGQVAQPGQYSIVDPEFRMLDALVMSKAAVNELENVFVIRKRPNDELPAAKQNVDNLEVALAQLRQKFGEQHAQVVAAKANLAQAQAALKAAAQQQSRVIAIPVRRLTDGDLSLNIVVRPGDVLIVRGAEQSPIRLVVDAKGTVVFRGERTTWQELPKLIEKMPAAARARSTLIVAPASDEMTLRQLNDAESQARALAAEYGFKDVTVVRIAAPATAGSATRP